MHPGLEDMSDASLPRGREGWRQVTNESIAVARLGLDLSRAGHSRGQPLQLEEGLAVAGRGGSVIQLGT